ncbi:MAG: CHAD domain-containing protein [Acidobacteriota bacterium]
MNTFIRQQTTTRWMQWWEAMGIAHEDPHDSHAIHDLRVAIRRLTQCFRLFEEHFDAAAVGKFRKQLHRLMRNCGVARNHHIAEKLLEDAGFGKSSASMRFLSKGRKQAEKTLAKDLKKMLQRKEVEAAALTPAPAAPEDLENPMPDLVGKFFAAGREAATPASSYAEMHHFRVDAKHFRYSVELFEPRFEPDRLAPILAALRELQDKLGDMNDCVTALELLKKHKRASAAIQELLEQREHMFRSHWKRYFGPKKEGLWISTFSAMGKPSPAPRKLKTRRADLLRPVNTTSGTSSGPRGKQK